MSQFLVNFTLTGATDLLFHADDIDKADELTNWRKDPANKELSKKGDDRSPPWTWTTYLYHDGEHLVWPSDNLMVCLRQAATEVVLQKSKTAKEVSQSGIFIPKEFLTFTSRGKPVPMKPILALYDEPFPEHQRLADSLGFKLFAKRAKVGQAKHVRVRARFSNWAVSGTAHILRGDVLTREMVERIFRIAETKGLGDWRPSSKTPGAFGQFKAKLAFGEMKAAA